MSGPSLKVVCRETFNARAKWRFLLMELDVDEGTIEAIETRYSDPAECLRKGLSEWLNGGERSWRDVADALSSRTVGHTDLAKHIERVYLQAPDSTEGPQGPQPHHEQPKEFEHQIIRDDLLICKQKLLGSGASGTVFKGLYRDSPCAVKVLHHVALSLQTSLPSGPGLDETVKRFDRECDFLKSFKHPNVVKHLTTARHPKSGSNILVTELLDCNLSTYLPSSAGSLSTDGEISIARDIAMGLAYIHSRNVIHRDLCGYNILLKLTESVPLAKISDFGLSRLLTPSAMTHTLTALHHRDGYMPPEAARSTGEQYDESIDVFSIGVIMLQIVCRVDNVISSKDRNRYLKQMPTSHPMKIIIEACLSDKVRPSASNVGSELQVAPILETEVEESSTELRSPVLIQSKKGTSVPITMDHGHSVVIDDVVFVGGSYTPGLFESSMYTATCNIVIKFQSGQWTTLPAFTTYSFTMAAFNSRLILVGGADMVTKKSTDQVSMLDSGQWIHPYPAMNISRYSATAVSFDSHIIVAGGIGVEGEALSTVEVFDAGSRTWHIAQPLPGPVFLMKPAVMGDTLYLMGAGYQRDATKLALKIILPQLIHSALSERATPAIWEQIEETPLYCCAPASVGGSLLAVGGRNGRGVESSSIYLYQPYTNSWVKAGELQVPKTHCTCSVLSSGEIIVIGRRGIDLFNSMEILTLQRISL